MRKKQSTGVGVKMPVESKIGGGSNPSKSPGCGATASIDASSKASSAKSKKHFSLGKLPTELLRIVGSGVDNPKLAALANTSKLFSAGLKSELDARRLMHHVVRGEQVEAEALLIEKPRLLLFCACKTIDYSGRIIQGKTAWQAALSAGDDDMLMMMAPFFKDLNMTIENDGDFIELSGNEIMNRQTQQLFPEGIEAQIKKQAAAESVFDFDNVVAAINGANGAQLASAIKFEGAILPATEASTEMTNAGAACQLTMELNKFREAYTDLSLNEQIFNPQNLLRALEIYEARYGNWNYDQCQVFWMQVVGFAQRFMTACYAQAFAQGLNYLVGALEMSHDNFQPEAFERSLVFKSGGEKIFSDRGDFSGFQVLGFVFAVEGMGKKMGIPPWTTVAARYKKLCEIKASYIAGLCPNPYSRSSQHLSMSR